MRGLGGGRGRGGCRPRSATGCSRSGAQLHGNAEGQRQRTGEGRKQTGETTTRMRDQAPGHEERTMKTVPKPGRSTEIPTRRLAAERGRQRRPGYAATPSTEERREEDLPSEGNTFQYPRSPASVALVALVLCSLRVWQAIRSPTAFPARRASRPAGNSTSGSAQQGTMASVLHRNPPHSSKYGLLFAKLICSASRMPGGRHARLLCLPYTK